VFLCVVVVMEGTCVEGLHECDTGVRLDHKRRRLMVVPNKERGVEFLFNFTEQKCINIFMELNCT